MPIPEPGADILLKQNVLLGQLLTQWITRFYGLHAASGALSAEAMMAAVKSEAEGINARLAELATPPSEGVREP